MGCMKGDGIGRIRTSQTAFSHTTYKTAIKPAISIVVHQFLGPQRKNPPAPSTTIWYSRLIRMQLVFVVWEGKNRGVVDDLLRPHWDCSYTALNPIIVQTTRK